MSEQKMEELVKRLEAAVKALESKGKGGSAGGDSSNAIELPPLDDFNALINEFQNLGNKLDLIELHAMTDVVISVVDAMRTVWSHSAVAQKPDKDTSLLIQKAIMSKAEKLNDWKNHKTVGQHQKCIFDGVSSFLWVFNDCPAILFSGCIESAEFNALRTQKLGNQSHTKWVNTYVTSLKNLKQYAVTHFKTGLEWNRDGTSDHSNVLKELTGQAPVKQPEKKSDSVNPGMGGLFDEINKGSQITQGLKKAEKGQPVQAQPKRDSLVKNKSNPTPTSKTQGEAKPARKFLQGQNWFVEHFHDETITFEDKEVKMSQSIFIDNCSNTTVVSNSKCKSVFVTKGQKVNLVVKSCIASVEIVKCKDIHLVIQESVPSVIVDGSEAIHLCLTSEKNTEVVSSKTTELNLSYRLPNGDQAKDQPVPEQFQTAWDEKEGKFKSKPLEIFM